VIAHVRASATISERTKAVLAAARVRGVKLGGRDVEPEECRAETPEGRDGPAACTAHSGMTRAERQDC